MVLILRLYWPNANIDHILGLSKCFDQWLSIVYRLLRQYNIICVIPAGISCFGRNETYFVPLILRIISASTYPSSTTNSVGGQYCYGEGHVQASDATGPSLL